MGSGDQGWLNHFSAGRAGLSYVSESRSLVDLVSQDLELVSGSGCARAVAPSGARTPPRSNVRAVSAGSLCRRAKRGRNELVVLGGQIDVAIEA